MIKCLSRGVLRRKNWRKRPYFYHTVEMKKAMQITGLIMDIFIILRR